MVLSRTLAGVFLLAAAAVADVRSCDCDPARPETMAARECGLCREAEKQPADAAVFFLKDINPRKPNRWLALPRTHGKGGHSLADLPPAQRAEFWSATIAKAKELWGDQWGLAVNGDESRTQCHAHVHIGKLLDGGGYWIHPDGNKLHVHTGETITETVLLR